MVHRQGQHDPVPVSALVMSADNMDDLKAFLTDLIDKKAPPPAVLSNDQFDKLVSLLQPGYELSSLYLAEHKRANAPIVPGQPPTAHGVPASSADLARDADLAKQREAQERQASLPARDSVSSWSEAEERRKRDVPAYSDAHSPGFMDAPNKEPRGSNFADTPPAVNEEVPASEAAFTPSAPAPPVSPRAFTPPPAAPTPGPVDPSYGV